MNTKNVTRPQLFSLSLVIAFNRETKTLKSALFNSMYCDKWNKKEYSSSEMKKFLTKTIEKLYSNGYRRFEFYLVGEFELLAANITYKLKKKYPDIIIWGATRYFSYEGLTKDDLAYFDFCRFYCDSKKIFVSKREEDEFLDLRNSSAPAGNIVVCYNKSDIEKSFIFRRYVDPKK